MKDAKISEKEKKYHKKVILTFDRYRKRKDLLSVLLKDNKYYTINEVDEIINKFMGGK